MPLPVHAVFLLIMRAHATIPADVGEISFPIGSARFTRTCMKITIGISFFNNADTLLDTIRSVLAQTWTDWELILVDDGSTDGSGAKVAALRDARIRVMADGGNRGLVSRLNQIARLATGDLLARMDADDLMHPDRLRLQAEFLQDHPDVHVVGTGVCSIDGRNRPLGARSLGPLDTSPYAFLRDGAIVHASVVGRRDWFLANPYDAGYRRSQDRELWARTIPFTRFGKVPLPLYLVREIGEVNPRKYLESYVNERRVLSTYGPSRLGRLATMFLLTRSHLKSMVLRVLIAHGQSHRVMKRHVQPFSSEERERMEQAIARILATPLPGLEHPARPPSQSSFG